MSFSESRLQMPIGARSSKFWPITAEPVNAHPTYASSIDMGANIKAYVSVQVASGVIYGDDVEQFSAELFSGGQLDAETTLDELEVNATLFGHKYTAEDGEESNRDDVAQDGGYSCRRDSLWLQAELFRLHLDNDSWTDDRLWPPVPARVCAELGCHRRDLRLCPSGVDY